MKSEMRSQAFLQKRKMLLVLPLLTLPFLTMAFWAFGGGKGSESTSTNKSAGLNLNLPSSNLKDGGSDNKLSFYDKAAKDSLKMEEMMRNDPYYNGRRDTLPQGSTNELENLTASTASKFKQQLNTSPYEVSGDNAEQKLMQKLSLLQKEMSKPTDDKPKGSAQSLKTEPDDDLANQMNRLESMMQTMGGSESGDPEMAQLSGTLEKILDIQHPDRVKARLKEKSLQHKEAAFSVTETAKGASVSLLDTPRLNVKSKVGFFGLDETGLEQPDDNAIEAEVATAQTIVNGAVVRLRLTSDVYINGKMMPTGSFVNGIASLNDERLQVEIKAVKSGKSILPVQLEVYDLDGIAGIYIPGAISRDVAKQSADNSLQLLELSTMDPTLKAQAAAAGVNAAKNLLSRKVKQIKVSLKAGYKVLLKNKQEL
ncbi:conjugative transposon protein TraM [Flavisolibacter sp. BT320]|nr:conjugative transposon protein TraM [Flavisolibacter longurius]